MWTWSLIGFYTTRTGSDPFNASGLKVLSESRFSTIHIRRGVYGVLGFKLNFEKKN